MPRKLLLASLAVATLALSPRPVFGQIVTDYAPTGSEAVVDGVSHDWGTSETDTSIQHVNVLRVATGAQDVDFELGLPAGEVSARQRTTVQAANATTPGHRVVAAVNGDFWQTSDSGVYAPAGLNIGDGELMASRGDGDRAALGQRADGSYIIGKPAVAVTVSLPGSVTVHAAGVNRVRAADELVVYTPRFASTTGTDATGIEVSLVGGVLPISSHGTYTTTVAKVRPSAGDSAISDGDLVLSATGTAAAALAGLHVGNAVTVQTTIDEPWSDVDTAVGGVLLFKGDATPDFSDPKYLVANPRTAAGIDAHGNLLLVTVDGRSETSGGLIMTDLVDLMRSLGAVDAINLDGGGSTTMAVDPAGEAPFAVANAPSQGHERRVNTTVQIVSVAAAEPSVSALLAAIVPDVKAAKTDAAVRLSWTPDPAVTVTSTELQRFGGDGEWHDVALDDPRATTVIWRFVFGKAIQFRVRVVDDQLQTSGWSASPVYVLDRYNESNAAIVRTGSWKVRNQSSAMGGHFARSGFDGRAHVLSMNVSGLQVAVVAQKSRSAGKIQVTIGSSSALIDTHAGSTLPRMVVYVGSGDSMSIANAASHAYPYADIDAILVLRSQ